MKRTMKKKNNYSSNAETGIRTEAVRNSGCLF